MIVEFHNRLANPQRHEATRIVIYDRHGNPIALAMEVEDGIVIAETAANEFEFNSLLRSLGIRQTVVVSGITQKPLPEIRFPQTFTR